MEEQPANLAETPPSPLQNGGPETDTEKGDDKRDRSSHLGKENQNREVDQEESNSNDFNQDSPITPSTGSSSSYASSDLIKVRVGNYDVPVEPGVLDELLEESKKGEKSMEQLLTLHLMKEISQAIAKKTKAMINTSKLEEEMQKELTNKIEELTDEKLKAQKEGIPVESKNSTDQSDNPKQGVMKPAAERDYFIPPGENPKPNYLNNNPIDRIVGNARKQDIKKEKMVNIQSPPLVEKNEQGAKNKEGNKEKLETKQDGPAGVCENAYKKKAMNPAGNVSTNKMNGQSGNVWMENKGVKQGQTPPSFASLFSNGAAKIETSVLAGLTQPEIKDKEAEMHRGLPAIRFEEAEIKQLNAIENHLLIGKFSWGRPKLDDIRRYFDAHFLLKGSLTIGWIDPRHISLAFSSEEDCLSILMRDQILFEGKFPMRIFRWTLGFSTEKESSLAPVWVKLPMLSANLFNMAALRQICKPLGKFLAADHATLNFTRPSYARVRVEIDLLKPLVKEVFIGFSKEEGKEDVGYIQKIEYERVPYYCSKCYKQGHTGDLCRAGNMFAAGAGTGGSGMNERGRKSEAAPGGAGKTRDQSLNARTMNNRPPQKSYGGVQNTKGKGEAESSKQGEERGRREEMIKTQQTWEGEQGENKGEKIWEIKGNGGRGGGRGTGRGTGGRSGDRVESRKGKEIKIEKSSEWKEEKEAGDCKNPFQPLGEMYEEGEVGNEENDPGPQSEREDEKDEDYVPSENENSEELEEEMAEKKQEIDADDKRKAEELNATPMRNGGNQMKAKASKKSRGSSKKKK